MRDATLSVTTHATPIGDLYLAGSHRGISRIGLMNGSAADLHESLLRLYPGYTVLEVPGFFAAATQAIDAYFNSGAPLKLPVDLDGGTLLQRAVWLAISRIPYGQTLSYTALAERVGFPRAVRAVASACGANPVPLIIPCHRVISKDGSLGGFSLGGIEIKERLLTLEREKERIAA